MDTNDQNAPAAGVRTQNRKLLLFILIVALLAVVAGVFFAKDMLRPGDDQGLQKKLTDEEKRAIEQKFGASSQPLSDKERNKIEKLFTENTSAKTLSKEEKRAIEERFSQ